MVGSSPRPSAKTRMKITAQTNSGIAVADRPPTEMSAVARRALVHGGEDAAEDRERHDDDERQQRQLGRGHQRVEHDVRHRPVHGTTEVAEVAGDEARRSSPRYCTISGRSVPSCWLSCVDRGLVGERAEDAPPHVAGQHLRGEEDEDAEQQQRDQAESEALGEEACDRGLLASARRRAVRPVWPAWVTSTWPIAETSTPADRGLSSPSGSSRSRRR